MWKRICYRDWYKYILDEEEIYCKVSNKREIYEEIDDWCVQARRLYHGDYHVLHRIEKLTELPLNNTFWSKFDIILRGKYDTLLPILYKITTQDGERNSDTKYGLELKTCAQHLLDHILHGPFYQLAWRGTDDLFPDADYLEPLFLDIAKFDSAYPLISGKILEVRQRIRNRIDKKINSQWDTFWNDSTVNKMRLIIASTLKTLRIGKCKTAIPEECFFVEDCFITRIYAGEVIGHRFLLLVILQSICRQYNIITHVSYDYLIIEDPTHPDGEFYFTLTGSHVERKLVYRRELRKMVSNQASLMMQHVDTLLAEYLKPLDGLSCLHFCMHHLKERINGTISTYYKSLPDPTIIKSDYTPIYEADYRRDKSFNSFEHKKHIQKLFPYSKRNISWKIYNDMSEIYSNIRHMCEGRGGKQWDDYNIKDSNWYRDIRRLIVRYYPWDYHHITGRSALIEFRDYMVPGDDDNAIVTYAEGYKDPIQVGTFMRKNKKELILILCQVNVNVYSEYSIFTSALTCEGFDYDISVKEIDNGTTYPISLEEINTFIEVVRPLNTLGMIFRSFDNETGIGILNVKTKDTIERELKERNIVIIGGDKNKRQKVEI